MLIEDGRRCTFLIKEVKYKNIKNSTLFYKGFYKIFKIFQMDKKETENAITTNSCLDNIPAVTADLETLTIDTSPPPIETKRVFRKRIPKTDSIEIRNRRCSVRPKKRMFSELDSEENIKEYYLNKNIKRKSNNLETIYEENDNTSDDNVTCMSVKRIRRMLLLSREPTASKIKKRRAKIQKVFGSKIKYKRQGSMQTLVDKLNTIRESSPKKIDSKCK